VSVTYFDDEPKRGFNLRKGTSAEFLAIEPKLFLFRSEWVFSIEPQLFLLWSKPLLAIDPQLVLLWPKGPFAVEL
jgi:hypothetical protein